MNIKDKLGVSMYMGLHVYRFCGSLIPKLVPYYFFQTIGNLIGQQSECIVQWFTYPALFLHRQSSSFLSLAVHVVAHNLM